MEESIVAKRNLTKLAMYGTIFFVYTILTIAVSYHFIFSFASVSTNSGTLSKFNGNSAWNDMISNESLREISHIYQVKIGNSIYPVTISSDIIPVSNLLNNQDQNSIILVLDTQDYNNTFTNGTMTIDIPRIVLDSQKNKKDENFTVTVDNQPANYIEVTHENRSKINSNNTYSNTTSLQPSSKMDTRKLMIELNGDSKIVRITGTEINDWVIQSNQTGQVNSSSKPTSQSTNDVQNIYIAFVSASIGIIVAIIYFLYRNKRVNFTK